MKLIILDRDGVINEDSDAFVKSLDEWVPLPGAIDAIARLSKAGWTIAVATNQSGLARGLFTRETLQAMHDELQRLVAEQGGEITLIRHCPHGPDDGCDCRKPLPGLYRQIAASLGVDNLVGVPTVGESLRDLQAGQAVGCLPFLVLTGKGTKTVSGTLPAGTRIFADLAAVANHLMEA